MKTKTEGKTYYAVMKLQKWENIKLESVGAYRLPFPVSLQQPEGGEIGYIAVFDSYESAVKFNDGKTDNIGIMKEV